MNGYNSSGCTTWFDKPSRHEPIFHCGQDTFEMLKRSLNINTMTPFEIKVTIPISKSDVYENTSGCSRNEIGIVSVEKAIAIRDAINRQLAGLKATAPKKKTQRDNTKKPSTKKRK